MEFALSQPKLILLPQNKKQTYRLNSRPRMWPSDLILANDLDLEFSRSNMEFAITQPKMVWLSRNEKQTYRFNSRPWMHPSDFTLARTLTLNFQQYGIYYILAKNGLIAMKWNDKQRVLMHGHQGWNVRYGLCHIYIRYVYIWVVYSFCLFSCLFIIARWWFVWCIEWASGNQEEVQACLVTLWLFLYHATVYTKSL